MHDVKTRVITFGCVIMILFRRKYLKARSLGRKRSLPGAVKQQHYIAPRKRFIYVQYRTRNITVMFRAKELVAHANNLSLQSSFTAGSILY
jgi:hypothetical protein